MPSFDPLRLGALVASGALLTAGVAYYVSQKKTEPKKSEQKQMEDFPVFDLTAYINGTATAEETAKLSKQIAEQLHTYGMLIIRDPRTSEADNDKFIDMMERYFEQPEALKAADAHPEYFYQVGVTPNGIEQARDHCDKVAKLADDQKPVTLCPPGADPKWRFFWRMGERPEHTKFAQLNASPVIPAHFPEWADVMNMWGGKLLNAVHSVAELAAGGFDLPKDSFTKLLKFGPHLLAPTGSDLQKFGSLDTVFANYHYDLNFLTIHGRSRFPGLYVWTRDGKRYPVRMPAGCLLLQAGKQFEYLTGGEVLAGFHEVVVAPATLDAIERAKANKKSLWRVSSTLFSHVASDQVLMPIAKFNNAAALEKYPPMLAGDQVQNELKAIKLGKPSMG